MNIKKHFKLFLAIIGVLLVTTLGVYAFSFRNMTLDFVHVSDTHISDRQDTSYKALSSSRVLLKDIVEQINNIQGLDFILFTGDLVDSASKNNFDMYYNSISRLKYPSLNTFGNHDFYGNMTKEEVLDTVKEHNKNYIFDDTFYAITPKTDYRIIVLDSTIKNENTSNGRLSQEQLDFLDNELSENQDKIVIIAMHHAAVEPFIASEHALLNAKEFNEILIKYKNPIVVLSGHYHAAKIRRIGNIVYVSTPALVTYPMAARHIKIINFKDRVQYKFEFLPTKLDDIKETNRQNVISYATLAGSEKDRNIEFTYYKKRSKSVNYKRKKIEQSAKEQKISKREMKKLLNNDKSEKKAKKEKKEKIKKEKVKKERKSFFKKSKKSIESQEI